MRLDVLPPETWRAYPAAIIARPAKAAPGNASGSLSGLFERCQMINHQAEDTARLRRQRRNLSDHLQQFLVFGQVSELGRPVLRRICHVHKSVSPDAKPSNHTDA